ncbi:MAG: SpoIIE family protein phosphatase [Gaiellaceae bacterium]
MVDPERAERRLSGPAGLDERLAALADALAAGTGADTVVLRLADRASGRLVARAVASASPVLAAELEGTWVPLAEGGGQLGSLHDAASGLRGVAQRAGSGSVIAVPVEAGGERLGVVELLRTAGAFSQAERTLARLAASQMAVLAGWRVGAEPDDRPRDGALDTAGDALAGGAEGAHIEHAIARLATRAAGARAGALWELGDNGAAPVPVATAGSGRDAVDWHAPPKPQSGDRRLVVVGEEGEENVVTLRLDESPAALLQLVFDGEPQPEVVRALEVFAGRARRALRASRRADRTRSELARSRALLGVVGQAIAELSLAHTLETAVARVGELLGTDRVAVYLRAGPTLRPAAARGLGPRHDEVAAALLDLAQGPLRARGALVVEDAETDPGLAGVRDAVGAAGLEALVAAPLVVLDEAIGLLVAALPRGCAPSEDETALLVALAAQLGVAVQNARLHEDAKRLGAERERALQAERQASRRLRAFYEVSQSFTESMSLPETLGAVARTAVDLLDADAAVIRTYDERREVLVPQAVHVADERLAAVLTTMLDRPHEVDGDAARAFVGARRATLLTPADARSLGEAYELFVPFLERGGTVAVVPVASAGELIAALTVVSLDPQRPLDAGSLDAATSLATHAALAVDNARLYQQQQHFLESMQQALLPHSLPEVSGLELARAYESSARLEVGGDVYDFLALDERRLAVVLGDVTGHGVDAAADMAMAKYVFRSLVRKHPEPGDLLAAVNEVVGGEIALGKFITMVAVLADGATGVLRCASAGHPPPRLVRASRVEPLDAGGLALGISPDERYEEVSATLAPGDAVVLYTDGVIEARCGSEFYGVERLDVVLAANAGASAEELAAAVLADCRAFGSGELQDDCAILVVRRV